jgi:hypothetical protein
MINDAGSVDDQSEEEKKEGEEPEDICDMLRPSNW